MYCCTATFYIISVQKGPGCMSATTALARLDRRTKSFDVLLPSLLPKPRYAPGVEIVTDPRDHSRMDLHVFGGASERRKNQTARLLTLFDASRSTVGISENLSGKLRSHYYLMQERMKCLSSVPKGYIIHYTGFLHAGSRDDIFSKHGSRMPHT
jgi:hypothetical protein